MNLLARLGPQILHNETVRYCAGLAGLAGSLSATIYFVVAGLNSATPPYARAIIGLSVLAVLCAVGGFTAIGLYFSAERRRRALYDHSTRMQTVLTEMNAALATDFLFCRFLEKQQLADHFDEEYVLREFDRYVGDFLDHVARIFTVYTGDQCAASIKVFSESVTAKVALDLDREPPPDPPTDVSRVYTLGRDRDSKRIRSHIDTDGQPLALYPHSYNTAFRRITHDQELCGYYVGEKLSANPEYVNARQGWEKDYDAVAVASLKNPTKKAVDQAQGFLCVDNKLGGFVDQGVCREVLESLASIAYYTIRKTIGLLKLKANNPAGAAS